MSPRSTTWSVYDGGVFAGEVSFPANLSREQVHARVKKSGKYRNKFIVIRRRQLHTYLKLVRDLEIGHCAYIELDSLDDARRWSNHASNYRNSPSLKRKKFKSAVLTAIDHNNPSAHSYIVRFERLK